MSPSDRSSSVAPPDASATAAGLASMRRAQWRQTLVITVVAVGIYAGLRVLPTGTNLNHMDFRAQGTNSIEFCDPLNPQFIPVVEARSPVSLTLKTPSPAVAGHPVTGVLTMRTASGKAVAPEDLLVVHTRPLHLMAVDPTLRDYQHLHPTPSRTAGEWTFSFTPRATGTYRLFADFTPVATARGLYASTDLTVADLTGKSSAGPRDAAGSASVVEQEGYRFELSPASSPVRAKQPVDYTFRITATSGKVPLEPVMGAYAHLVAFDVARSGFAHLHPAQPDPLQPPDPVRPVMTFKLTIPKPGRYVIWSQVNLGGDERFVPFWFDVAE